MFPHMQRRFSSRGHDGALESLKVTQRLKIAVQIMVAKQLTPYTQIQGFSQFLTCK